MKNGIHSVITLSLLLFFSCTKDDPKPYVPVKRCPDLTRNRDTINFYIHGTWEWIEEKRINRIDGIVYFTPNSPGWYSTFLKLSNDTAFFMVNGLPDSVYQYRIQELSEITNYPEDSIPVISYYSFNSGLRKGSVPIMICNDQLLMQYQFVSSLAGERIWKRR